MAPAQLKIKLENPDVLRIGLERGIKNRSTILDDIGKTMVEANRQHIIKQVDPFGEAFAPLQKSTIDRKKALGLHLEILRATDKMLNSISFETTRDVVRILVTGDAAKYALFHMTGTKFMPSRPFLGISKSERTTLNRKVKKYVANSLKEK